MAGWISNAQQITQTSLPMSAKMPIDTGRLESIMLFGKAKTGKTWAACSMIDEIVKADPTTTIFYICTDNGLDMTFDFYFQRRADEVRKSVVVYRPNEYRLSATIPFFTAVSTMFFEIRSKAKARDWIVVDLADKFWNWAQDEWIVQSSPQNSPTTYMNDAAKDLKKLMEFQRSQWQFIKRLDNIATFDIIDNPPCNLMYVFGENDTPDTDNKSTNVDEEKINNAVDLVGCIPAGQKKLPYAFNTLVYLSGLRDKRFIMLGDRGIMLDYREKIYGKNWYAAFQEERARLKKEAEKAI